LTSVGNRLDDRQITLRILNGGYNMPAFASILKPDELSALVQFLHLRNPYAATGDGQKE
jgi:ubiquinol-cytochrome c reductase cytochrome b subunit